MENKTLYVGNLAYSADEHDLEIAFSSYGSVDDIKLMRDRETGRPGVPEALPLLLFRQILKLQPLWI